MSIPLRTPLATALSLLGLAGAVGAQQFTYTPGLIPGTPRWTEGVEAADVDNDGDLDLFFAEGDGFTFAGTKRQNILQINQFVGSGSLSFTNESVARLGARVSNAKGVATGDIDGDGWIDAIFANGFNTDPPFLYHNRAAGQPGFYDEEAAARGLTEVLNSAGAGFGDLDDDGDLDLIVNDSGSSFLGGSGDKAVLYINDGTGNFTEKTGSGWNPPIKKAQMDVQFSDVDGDWDLDFIGYCRGSNSGGNHYLMLNDGNANFTDASSLLPNGSSNCYEAEVGDLDGDLDPDIFMVSLTSMAEGAVRNNFVENGSANLTFTALSPQSLSQDDNEISLCDYDNDGDYDAFVGSLVTKERIWKNNGSMNFAGDHGNIQTVGDSTLDCTHADLDNDGDYEFITAQGESNPGQYVNKVYINSGSADTLAPVVIGERIPDPLAGNLTGPWIAQAKVQDQVMDDGKNWVSAEAHYAVVQNPASPAVSITAGGFSPPNLNVSVGDTVVFNNASGGVQTVTSTTAPYEYDSGAMANGQLFTNTFVRAGVYNFTSTNGGFNGSVTVSGSTTALEGTYSGGGLYRFGMTGDASPMGSALPYELEFTDWAGNVRVTTARLIVGGDLVGTPFCFGDGSGTACPCAAVGGAGNGCPNSGSGAGANLRATGSTAVVNASLTLLATQCPANRPGLFFQGQTAIAGGVAFGDGLRCAGGQIQRLEVVFIDGAGSAASSVDIVTVGAVLAGQTRRYQFWFRDPTGACGGGFNTSNGIEIVWN